MFSLLSSFSGSRWTLLAWVRRVCLHDQVAQVVLLKQTQLLALELFADGLGLHHLEEELLGFPREFMARVMQNWGQLLLNFCSKVRSLLLKAVFLGLCIAI